MGSALLTIFSILPVVNAATIAIAGAVIGACAFMSRAFGHIPDWMVIPPIMMSGYMVPESVFYSSGFTVVAIGLFFSQSLLFLLRRAMLQRDWTPTDKNLTLRFINICEYSFSIVCAISVVVQAVVPVQENVFYTFFDYVEVEKNTVTHETATACWWFGEALHWILNFIVEKRSPQLSIIRRYRSFMIKFAFVALGIISGVIGLFVSPSLPAPKSTVLLYFHITNFCWWLSTVCFFVAYFVQSWQAAILLDHLGIRSFVFGTLSAHKHYAGEAGAPPVSEMSRNVEEGDLPVKHNSD